MPKLFFLLSGENQTLPAAEIKAILKSEDFSFKNPNKLDQILQLEAELDCVGAVAIRSAYTRFSALELFVCKASMVEIIQAVMETDFSSVLNEGESFVVRVNRIKEYADNEINTMTLEVKLGEQILRQTPGSKVNLKCPDKTFIGIITDDKLVFGLKLTEITSKTFSERRPRKKPFFHPSAMPSKMARCMVNLAHAKAESMLLDPFCGTGTSLIEAIYIGCRAVGVDAQRRMILGTEKNLRHFGIEAEGLVLADSRKIPLLKVDAIVTDPPYGRSCSTLQSTTRQLAEEILASSWQILSPKQRICIALPITVNEYGKIEHLSKDIAEFVSCLGFKTIESHLVFIHRSLTREIMVYEKT